MLPLVMWLSSADSEVFLSVRIDAVGGGCVQRLKKYVQFKLHKDSLYDMKDREEGAGSSGLSNGGDTGFLDDFGRYSC